MNNFWLNQKKKESAKFNTEKRKNLKKMFEKYPAKVVNPLVRITSKDFAYP